MAVNEKVGIDIEVKTGSLRTQLREATQEFIKLQESGTATAKEINNAAKRAADLKERISDAKDTIAAFNPEAKFKAFGQVVQGVAGAFAATQGAMALLGVEGEEVNKTLLKVQGALALSEGLNTVLSLQDAFGNLSNRVRESSLFIGANSVVTSTAGKIFKIFGAEVVTTSLAFRGLKLAIASTGIGLLVVALGEVVTQFQKFSNGAKEAEEAQKKLNEEIIKGAQAQKEGEKDSLKRQEELELARAKRKGASEAELFAIQDKYARLAIKSQERYFAEIKGKGKEADDAEKELKNLKSKRDTDLINNETALILKNKENQTKANQEALAQQQKDFDEFIANNQKRQDRLFELQKLGGSEYEKKVADLKAQYEADLKLFSDSESAKAFAKKQFDEAVFEASKEEKERLRGLDDKYADKKIKDLEKEGDKQRDSTAKTFSMITATMNKSLKKQADDEVKIRKLTEDEKLSIISGSVQMGIKIAGEGTVVGKALAIADATINTYVGASRALKDLPAPFSFIAAATTIASGLMTVQQILQTPIPSSAGVSDTSGGGSIGGAPPMTPRPQMTAPTELGATSLNTISNVVARAYVVESDITTSQQRISRIQNAARF